MTAPFATARIRAACHQNLALAEPRLQNQPVANTGELIRTRKSVLLLANNEAQTSRVLRHRLKLAGFRSSITSDAKQALEALGRDEWDVVLADVRTCKMSGIGFIREARCKRPSLAILALVSQNETNEAVQAMKEGADDCLVKPLDAKDLLRSIRRAVEARRALKKTARAVAERGPSTVALRPTEPALQSTDAYEHLLLALGTALDLRDSRTAGHSRRVCTYSLEIAQRMRCTQDEFGLLRQGALLHDIGKLAIPDAILWKPGPLTPDEWAIMKTHVQVGYEMVRNLQLPRPVAELIRAHHERYDGTGYPRGLNGEEIPLCARIFAVADAFDAMTTIRPYKDAIPLALAVEQIRRHAGKSFDLNVVEAFLAIPIETLDFVNQVYHTEIESTVVSM